MNILNIEKITKAYGVRKIFDNAGFYLEEGEKAGIIGVNGTGKSTLLKIIAGIEAPDTGSVIMAGNLTVRYLPQTPVFADDDTVLQAVVRENKTPENEWTVESDAKTMMTKLGIVDFDERCGHLSGGQKKRLALVSAMLAKADLLLLDEPTNHLDHEMSAWLEEQLRSYRGAVIMVTHDRYFLDSVADRIIEIDKGNIYSYKENYSGYLERKAERESIEDATERKRQSILRVELEWVKRGARARSTKQKARLDRYETLKNQSAPVRDGAIELSSMSSRLGRTAINLDSVTKAYGDKVLFKDFTYNFLKNDRVGIIGPNGCGKSTLLSVIMGELAPDGGDVEIGTTVRIGYFAQHITDMRDDMRVIDYIREVAEYVVTDEGKITATRLLERFLFSGENQYGPIGKLSGGEKRRLYLCRVLMSAPNVLVLDEPTNDLDITTLRVLEDYLDTFSGIVIAVSHDRYFLDRVVRRIFAFKGAGRLCQSEGGYTEYELRMKEEEKISGDVSREPVKQTAADKNDKNRQKPREKKLKFSYAEQKEYETIDEDIAELEESIEQISNEINACATDYVRLRQLSDKKQELEAELSHKMDRWMYLEELATQIEEAKKSP